MFFENNHTPEGRRSLSEKRLITFGGLRLFFKTRKDDEMIVKLKE
jgi:hypothetical protein